MPVAFVSGVAPARVRVAAAVVWDGPRILMTQRPHGDALELQWEFPGGKLEPGETPADAVIRELREELGVGGRVLEELHVERHDYAHGLEVEIVFLRCALDSLAFQPGRGVHAWRWIAPAEVDVTEVLEADRAFVRGLASP